MGEEEEMLKEGYKIYISKVVKFKNFKKQTKTKKRDKEHLNGEDLQF